jgi:protein-S-isoprenylcysteine O-methyltransferase Ste14
MLRFRWAVVIAVVGFWVWLFARNLTMRPSPHSLPFELWYGNWKAVLVASGIFSAFILAFLWPRQRIEWRNAGITTAFLISLFVEMFGLPLTIFVVARLIDLPPTGFGQNESHLWAWLLYRAGLLPLGWGVHLVMVVSLGLIALGTSLVVVGWAQVFGARYELLTSGIYRLVRHPQYLGLIVIVVAFNIQWPTLLTLAMAPVLIAMYVRQARREDEELATLYGEGFFRYAAQVPAFVPRLRSRPGARRERGGGLTDRGGMHMSEPSQEPKTGTAAISGYAAAAPPPSTPRVCAYCRGAIGLHAPTIERFGEPLCSGAHAEAFVNGVRAARVQAAAALEAARAGTDRRDQPDAAGTPAQWNWKRCAKMAACCGTPMLALVLLAGGGGALLGAAAGLLPLLAVLACPLGMFFMMRGMMRGGQEDKRPPRDGER